MTIPSLPGTGRPPPADPGLQPERTCLAWSRTAFILVINALLLLRGAATGGHRLMLAGGVILLMQAGIMWLWGYGRLRLPDPHWTRPAGQSRWMMALTTATVLVVSLLAALAFLG
ncbi:DUF202 domain-containing protein [Acerihabitans arboris]|uniref:DUF202 domain-containing protein n=1 Tax=Acerihabitans arboris TaxID=2691583 RepID=A0A845SML1_9GAMM|nr:DUF202 domain-containing protein [Acerihabitans arboris]NDL65239.1 DUF202 domain-containing protein [Acerihabitans arboris]